MLWTSASSRRRENNGRRTKRSAFRPRLEALEDRVTPVIGAYAPNPVPPGFITVDHVALDGVVQLGLSKPGDDGICTGSLLRSQRHILTAAHCLTDDNGMLDTSEVTVTFTFKDWAKPVVYKVVPKPEWIHPGWTGKIDDGNDIAILTLPSLAPSGPAGLGARGYLHYTGFDEEGKQFEFAGFGQTGGGDTGGIDGTAGTGKRLGYNRFDTRTKPVPFIGSDTGLAFDFDDGSVFNNTLVRWDSPKTPVKDGDSMIGKGDSGGPSFLNGLLAGVTSGTYAVNDFDPDGTFGDIGVVERVSLHKNWIESFTNAGYDLVIRMNEQRPEDGVKDTLKLLREGTNVVFYVNDQFYYLDASSRLSSVTIVGSSDSEDFLIDSDLRKIVNFQGGGGTNQVFVRNASGKATYEVSEGKVSTIMGLRALTLNYGGVQAVEVAGDSSDTVQVISVRSGTPLTVVNAGTVDVGGVSGGNLSAIKDLVTVNGSNTALTIDDATWTRPRDFDLYNDRLTVDMFGVATTIRYQGLTTLWVYGGGVGNVFTVLGTTANFTRLYTGAGGDVTSVLATSPGDVVVVEGQAGLDTVRLGLGRNMQNIQGPVRIRNQDGFSTINLENQADDDAIRDITLENSSGGNISIAGLAPGTIRVEERSVRALNIWLGDAGNGVNIFTTPQSSWITGSVTRLHTGNGHDVVNVFGTRGPLLIDGQSGTNQTFVGSATGGLDKVNGGIDVSGTGSNYLTVNDIAATTAHAYILDRDVVRRTDRPAITFLNLNSLSFTAGSSAETDTITVRDTVPNIQTNVSTGGGSDVMTVERTAPGLVVLGAGAATVIEVGTGTSSLDNIQGLIRVFCSPNNLVTLRLNDTAPTGRRNLLVTGTDSGQQYQRAVDGSGEWRTLVEVLFSPLLGAPVENFEYLGGSGGSTVFVNSTTAGTNSTLTGYPGAFDIFALGFGTDMNQILGAVTCAGQAADHDFAYYYEYVNPSSQSYTVFTHPVTGVLAMSRTGVATAQFGGLEQVIFYTPYVGHNTVDIRGIPAGASLNMASGHRDLVRLGSNAPNLGGTLDGIRGPVQVGGYGRSDGSREPATLIVDNSGNTDLTPRRAELYTSPGTHLVGLAPAPIFWHVGSDSSVSILGGAASETFAFRDTNFIGAIFIHGGGGVNTLDYSAVQGVAGQVSWYRAEGNAVDAVGGSHGTLQNGTTFAPGRVGQAFSFDGVDDFVEVADSPLHSPSSITLEAWVKPDTVAGSRAIATKYDSSTPDNKSWSLTSVDGRVRFGVYQGQSTRSIDTISPVLAAGVWHHVVSTFDPDTQAIKIYVDGEDVPSGFSPGGGHDATITAITDSSTAVRIGSIVNVQGQMVNYWDGLIDEVSIFNRALSAAEVQARFAAGDTGQPPAGPGAYVNLRTGQATGLAGGISNIQNVVGSAANDILVGTGGNVLVGGAGRDLLIAGITDSQLFGGGDEDLLIGGTTAHDTNRAALERVMAVWTSAADYETRVANLRAGLLGADSVSSNGLQNTVNGEGGRDAFFGSLFDLTDRLEDEVFVEV